MPSIAWFRPHASAADLFRFALALATFVAIKAFALAEADPVGGAESTFLGLAAAAVVAALAVISPPPSWELSWTALGAVTAIWIVGYGPHRGALVMLILLAGLVLAVNRRGFSALLAKPGPSAALALALQVLMRCDLLLPPLLDLRTLVSILALPAASGIALHLLARRFGPMPVWTAGAAVVVLSPGWNVTTTLALASLAAGSVLAERELPTPARAAAVFVLAVPLMWDLPLGLLFVLGALTFVAEGRVSWLLSMAGIAVLAIAPIERFGSGVLVFWSRGLVLVPALVAAAPAGIHLVLRGAFLALVATMLGGGPETLSGGLALAALGLPERPGITGLQRAWGNALVVTTTLLAAYPWLRADAFAAGLDLLGLGTPRYALWAALGLVLGAGLGLGIWRRYLPAPKAASVAVIVLGATLLRTLPSTAFVPIPYEPLVLSSKRQGWVKRFPSRVASGGVIDCHLVHGAELEPGTPIATIRLRNEDRKLLGSWEILAGFDTAEWAAARQDVAGRPGFRAPEPWLSQIAPDGTFFARRFRARFRTEIPVDTAHVGIRRHPDLPSAVELHIHRLELRR